MTLHLSDADEGRHLPGTEELWGESWYHDWAASDGSYGGYLRLGLYPNRNVVWYWVALVYDGKRMSHYIDGVLELEGEVAFAPMAAGRTSLGVRQNLVSWFKGGIAEARFTPAALPAGKLRREAQRAQ